MQACLLGHHDIVLYLMEHGADVDAIGHNGTTTMMHACAQGHTRIVLSLLHSNANMCLVNNGGQSALGYAINKGNLTTVQALIDNNIDLHNDTITTRSGDSNNSDDTISNCNGHLTSNNDSNSGSCLILAASQN